MVSILQRPQGVSLGDCITASIDEDYAGFATVNTTTAHQLSEGTQVYITSLIENYNGFWPIHVIDGYHFFLVNADGSYVAFIQDASITYCPQENIHAWNCVELPIVYKATNDKYPTNSVDTARTVLSSSNDNGLLNLTLSGSLGTFEDLAMIRISGAASAEINGVHRIADKLSTSNITLDLAYAYYDFTGATVQLYYASYNIVINVYAGLPAAHRWYDQKPERLIATLNFIPDENNQIMFSIAEILKGDVSVKNNLLLGTLPNNLDAFTGFRIEYAESYDTSDGYTITTLESSFTADTFQGWAVNAKLAFKNQYSGLLTEYVMNSITAKFLTLFAVPVLFPGCYQDVSFIIDKNRSISDDQTPYEAGYRNTETVLTSEWNLNTGVISFTENGVSRTEAMYIPFEKDAGSYDFVYDVEMDGTWVAGGNVRLGVVGMDENFTVQTSTAVMVTGISGSLVSGSGTVTLTAVVPIKYIGILIDVVGIKTSGTPNGYINSFRPANDIISLRKQFKNSGVVQLTQTDTVSSFNEGVYRMQVEGDCDYDQVDLTVLSNGAAISEVLTCDIACECDGQELFLMWQNNLGGFDGWKFTAFKDYIKDIGETGVTSKNTFPEWPKSYGEFADTEKRRQTFRQSTDQILVRTQNISLAELQAITYIKSSVLVQVVNSRYDRRTVIVDADSFTSYKDSDKLYELSFTITYTDDIPSQRV